MCEDTSNGKLEQESSKEKAKVLMGTEKTRKVERAMSICQVVVWFQFNKKNWWASKCVLAPVISQYNSNTFTSSF